MARTWWIIVCLLGGTCTNLRGADCGALKNLALENTTILLAEAVTSGTLAVSEQAPPVHGLPAFCRVTGIMRPTTDSEIRFEVWMPQQDWNGRFLGTGNGGFAGSIYYPMLAGYLRRGFAAAGSDAGHQAEGTDASWAFGHPEKVKDFGWRAVHLMTQRAGQIISAYYGKPAQKSYFDACSDGGREALMEAELFPEDYDGILAGAPANAWSTMLTAAVAGLQALVADPRAYIPVAKLAAIQKAALAACDELDGVKDGIINDPPKCRFDPAVLLCKEENTNHCLSPHQVAALKALYGGAKDGQGRVFFPGFSMGDETGWREWVVGEDPEASLGARFARNNFRYIVTGDPKWNMLTADVDVTLRQSKEKTAADLDSTNPDLSRFAARGGKLILYHGWDDAAISPANTVAYFNEVQKTMGREKVDSFARLYMPPGVEHCTGGPGPSAFGQLGIETAKGPKYGLFDSLQDWVEKGSPDADVFATKYAPGEGGAMKPVMTRPLCAYPTIVKYKGSGDTNDAASFTCAEP